MASYTELFALRTDSPLKNRVIVACVVAAEAIRTELGSVPNHANRLAWSAAVFANPDREGDRMYWAVLAANKSATVGNIQNATDAAIQTAVDAAVDIFAVGA
jgi:hypothetical protein